MNKETIFGERLRKARKLKGYTQHYLADLLEIYPSRISMWEAGKQEPNLFMVRKIAQALNVPSDYLLGISDKQPFIVIDDAEIRSLSRNMLNSVMSSILNLGLFKNLETIIMDAVDSTLYRRSQEDIFGLEDVE